MAELLGYGKVLASYEASGHLWLPGGQSYGCCFQAVQFADGAIRAQCYFLSGAGDVAESLRSVARKEMPGVEKLTGTSANGDEIELSGKVRLTRVSSHQQEEGFWVDVIIIAQEILVKRADDKVLTSLRFGVTNLEFAGNDGKTYKTETELIVDPRAVLSLSLPLGEARIERVLDYEGIMENLEALQGIDVTCEISLEIGQNGNIEEGKKALYVLCRLLSLARGTQIEWVYFDGYDADGNKCLTVHRYAVTMPYTGSLAAVIDPSNPEDNRLLIENGYHRFQEIEQNHALNYVIPSYIEAKRPHSYLNTRALSAIQGLELLIGKYAEQKGHTMIIDDELFESKIESLESQVKQLLGEAFGTEAASAMCNKDKLKFLNRPTFRQIMRDIHKDLQVPISSSSLDALVKTRNDLVHRASFHTHEPIQEYWRILAVMDKLLLKMLAYEGHFRDWEHKRATVKL